MTTFKGNEIRSTLFVVVVLMKGMERGEVQLVAPLPKSKSISSSIPPHLSLHQQSEDFTLPSLPAPPHKPFREKLKEVKWQHRLHPASPLSNQGGKGGDLPVGPSSPARREHGWWSSKAKQLPLSLLADSSACLHSSKDR